MFDTETLRVLPNYIKKSLVISNYSVVDFVADKTKLKEWHILLAVLVTTKTIKAIAIRSHKPKQTVLENINTAGKAQRLGNVPVLFTRYIIKRIVEVCCRCIKHSEDLNSIVLEGIPLCVDDISKIAQALQWSKSLKELGLPRCQIGDEGCKILCDKLCTNNMISALDLSGGNITHIGTSYLLDALKKQTLARAEECWKQSLRYRNFDLKSIGGLKRLKMSCNPKIDFSGIKAFCDSELLDDFGLEVSGDAVAAVLCWPVRQSRGIKCLWPCGVGISRGKSSKVIQVRPQSLHQGELDVQECDLSGIVCDIRISNSELKYPWLKGTSSDGCLNQRNQYGSRTRKIQSDPVIYSSNTSRFTGQAKQIKSCDSMKRTKNVQLNKLPNNSYQRPWY